MAASREKQRTHRKKVLEKAQVSVELHKPLETEASETRLRNKIKILAKSSSSALIKGEGQSMGMDID
jgi:large subunit ribosomal protein L24e